MGFEINTEINMMAVIKGGISLIVLLGIVFFLLTWSGLMKCNNVPFGCNIYDFVMGSPRVLIAYGDEGLGNPELLKQYLQDPRIVGAESVDTQHINNLSLGNLKNYKLIIVEQARQISYEQLQMFMDYTNQGGRLVWIGDAGILRGVEEVQNISDINSLAQLDNNPWVRVEKTGSYLLNFDEFLSLRYLNNYCVEKDCSENLFSVGILVPEPTRNHPLIFGAASQVNFKITSGRDFAIVRQIPNSPNSNVLMSIDFKSKLLGNENEINRTIPFIVTSGLGERVAYYAYPPEYLVQDNNSYILIKNMYYGMLGR
jgi:hypothetical protein